MQRFLIALVFVAGPAAAQDDATLNRAWGDIASQVARAGIMGEHSSAASPFTPSPDNPRRGVGNVSKEDFGPLSEGGQGLHAITNGGRLGSPNLDPSLPEAQVGPFSCQKCGATGSENASSGAVHGSQR